MTARDKADTGLGKLMKLTTFVDPSTRTGSTGWVVGYTTPDILIEENRDLVLYTEFYGTDNPASSWTGIYAIVDYSTDGGASWLTFGNIGYTVAMKSGRRAMQRWGCPVQLKDVAAGTNIRFRIQYRGYNNGFWISTDYAIPPYCTAANRQRFFIEEYSRNRDDLDPSMSEARKAAEEPVGIIKKVSRITDASAHQSITSITRTIGTITKDVGSSLYCELNLVLGNPTNYSGDSCYSAKVQYSADGGAWTDHWGEFGNIGEWRGANYNEVPYRFWITDTAVRNATTVSLRVHMENRGSRTSGRYIRYNYGSPAGQGFSGIRVLELDQ